MSDSSASWADQGRDARRVWAAPGSPHDRVIRIAMIVLPAAIGALAAVLLIAPLLARSEISFVLAKDKVAMATERMRASAARYRGSDNKGRPFTIYAGGAVQATSRVPVVAMNDLSAAITLSSGAAEIRAPTAQYDMEVENLRVPGPLLFASADGYRLDTHNVDVDLKAQTVASNAPIVGRMPLGNFRADRMRADLEARTVTLQGRARLHIVQGAVTAR